MRNTTIRSLVGFQRNAPWIHTLGAVLFIVWILSSCSPAATAGGTAIPIESPSTAAFSPTSTAIETQVPSQTPTRTQTPTQTTALTPTQAPTATKLPGLNFTGPFLMLSTGKGVIFMDFNGSALWTVDVPEKEAAANSPDRKWLAYVTGSVDKSGTYPERGVVLHLLNMSSGEVRDITDLIPQDYFTRLERLVDTIEGTDCESFHSLCLEIAVETLSGSIHAMAWSPDGKYLAFGAMVDGDSADLYTYDIDTGKTRRLGNEPGNPVSFKWSPDGKWITYMDNNIFNPIHSAWFAMEGRWAVQRNGAGAKKLSGPYMFHSWVSDYEYLGYWTGDTFNDTAPTVVNIETGSIFDNFHGLYRSIAIDPRSRLIAVVGSMTCKAGPECEGGSKSGLYLGPINSTLNYVEEYSVLQNYVLGDFQILPRGGTIHPFFGANGQMNKFVGITHEGRIDTMDFDLPFGNIPMISQNYWLAFFPRMGIRVYDPSDKLRFELSNEQLIMFDKALWDTNAQGIYYQTWVGDIFKIYYWKLGEPAPRWIVDIPDQGNYFSLALLVNLKSLPHLRILPTRAAKPAEGTSIWSRTAYKELFQPGINRYDITIPADSSWRWSFSLGTTDPKLFEKILLPEDVEFRINGEWIDSNMFRMTDKTEAGRFSRAWAAMLSGWRSGDKAELEIEYTLRSEVRDGNIEYPAGEYRQIISLVVE